MNEDYIGLSAEHISKILELEKKYPFVHKMQPPTFVNADTANLFLNKLKKFYYPEIKDVIIFPLLTHEISLLNKWIEYNNIQELYDMANALKIAAKIQPEKIIDKKIRDLYNRMVM